LPIILDKGLRAAVSGQTLGTRRWGVVIHTTNGVYEVRDDVRRYRRLADAPGALPGPWCPFDRMTPVRPGSPVVFFLGQDEHGRVLHFNVVRTSPVTQVLADSA
jgi:hypothetical protein